MPASTILKTKRDLTIEFGESGAWNAAGADQGNETLALVCDEGLSIDGGGDVFNTYMDRGQFGSTPKVRKGDEKPFDLSFKVKMSEFTDSSAATPLDLYLDDGFVSSDWASTLGANAEVKAFMMKVTAEGTDHGDSADHFVVFNHVTVESCAFSEGDFNEWSMTVKVHQATPFGSA